MTTEQKDGPRIFSVGQMIYWARFNAAPNAAMAVCVYRAPIVALTDDEHAWVEPPGGDCLALVRLGHVFTSQWEAIAATMVTAGDESAARAAGYAAIQHGVTKALVREWSEEQRGTE